MKKIGIILTPDSRSKAYLQKIITNNIILDEIIFLNDSHKSKIFSSDEIKQSKKYNFDISKSVKDILHENKLKYKEFSFVDINHPELIKYLENCSIDFFIFTGGGILKKEILNLDPKFVHLHPGIVPEYKGSTCFYYSMIDEGKCGVSAFIMDEGIDTGSIIYQKEFSVPNHEFIDEVYDSHIRSETLLDVLNKNLLESGDHITQDPSKGETYYIIHPVLKHIAILSNISKK